MDVTTLNKANQLDRQIKELNEALNCFEITSDYGSISRDPKLIIEYDDLYDNGREIQALPMNLSNELVKLIKREIVAARDKAVAEFNAL